MIPRHIIHVFSTFNSVLPVSCLLFILYSLDDTGHSHMHSCGQRGAVIYHSIISSVPEGNIAHKEISILGGSSTRRLQFNCE